ncbi:transketolase [Isosphaera pallida ATCC 43644]|uniref:Transketolase n=1 Tax=Isosphaera pallida (strain ATCC 43644 / DSM 9630 / IS1B) TaxID=575540 RepID=E8R5K9_ISOPI|nr:transketolase [Isosphaera pallida]ADV61758.1 transketolase [Isosphaera pallida ATCC 43644]
MSVSVPSSLETLSINTLRALAMDAVQKANSGHPGTPVSLAPVVYELWRNTLRYDPADPIWPDRDRFVLSVGHASMLIYGALHLAGVKAVGPDPDGSTGLIHGQGHGRRPGDPHALAVSLEDIKAFRQLHSKTPGHPEYRLTPGVETTTGPLGQGLANSVGMAIAGRYLAARYNRPGFDLFTHRVYALCGDGCMMEGVSSEAASLAGHLKLANLCWIYDSNHITIEGGTHLAFSEDVGKRFESYGWNVLKVDDAEDRVALAQALAQFQRTTDRPTLIIVTSVIARGVPGKEGSHKAHGEPLGEEAVKGAKLHYGMDPDARFVVPPEVYEDFQHTLGRRGAELSRAWKAQLETYRQAYPDLAAELDVWLKRELPAGWDRDIPTFPWQSTNDPQTGKTTVPSLAGRDASGRVLNAIAKRVPWLIGGSADLAPSTKTTLTFEGADSFQAESPHGRNFHFGVREHAMGSIMNGMAVSGLRPFGSGFLIFSDYGRPAIRLAAIMEIPVIYIFTHDSIGVGEDGPTHQPIEQLASLRAIPHLIVIRPADANEVAEAWRTLMPMRDQPVVLALTRQALPTLNRDRLAPASGLRKGAYVLADPPAGQSPRLILIGTGSEVALCVEAAEALHARGIPTRVVSMPSWELFEAQPQAYRDEVLPPSITARVAVEMGSTLGWSKYVGPTGSVIGMNGFGASAPLKDVTRHFGFTVENVIAHAERQLT